MHEQVEKENHLDQRSRPISAEIELRKQLHATHKQWVCPVGPMSWAATIFLYHEYFIVQVISEALA